MASWDMKRFLAAVIAAGSILAADVGTASAQDAGGFFKGKTVRITVGFAPGGGYDTYARLAARHWGNQIPGKPEIIVVNMPGASSLKSVQYLDAGAPKDGTVVTTFNPGLITQSLTTPETVKVRFTDYTWIGTMSRDVRVCYMWNATTKARSLETMRQLDQVVFGETGTGSSAYIEQRIIGQIFGVKVKQILGYPGSAEKRLAIERGELDGDCGAWTSIPPDWLRDGKISVVLRFARDLAPGMDDKAPVAIDLVSEPKKKNLLNLLGASNDFGRPYIAPKETPADRVAALRQSFAKTIADADFVAEAAKQKLTIIAPMIGEEAEKLLADIYATPADVVAEAKSISD